MTGRLRRLKERDREAGMTLVELLVAAAMSVVLVGAATSMLISAVRSQPELSEKSQAISTARWVLERMTREIRNGVSVYDAAGNRVVFLTQVRRTACGGGVPASSATPAMRCQVTYQCATTATTTCTRTETVPEGTGGTPVQLISGLSDDEVFNFSPDADAPTFIGVTLNFPDPDGTGDLTISDGAELRTLALTQ